MKSPPCCMSLSSGVSGEELGESTSLGSLASSVFCSEEEPQVLLQKVAPSLDRITINVGGARFVLSQQKLCCYPDTRLGKLAVVVSAARDVTSSLLDLCDDANLVENEYFFDRSSQAFHYIHNYYQTGRLHVMDQLCALSFLQEIQYWGLDELSIDSCCRDRYFRRKELSETLDIKKDAEELDAQVEEEDFSGSLCPGIRQKLWEVLDKPGSSIAARTFGTISMAFVVISIANMALISVELSWLPSHLLDILEYVCIAWFTGEFALRFLCALNRCRFMRNVANIIDLLAILPFYITLLVESLRGRESSQELENMGRIVQVLRLLRALRMLKLGRHSTGLRSLGMTIAQCYEEVGMLLLFLSVGISIFSTMEYFVEQSVSGTTFTSVPSAWWWATTSMTTVGYGDIRPETTIGKIVAFMCILSGILVLALPIAIINDRFSACYFTLKIKEAALHQREALRKLTKNMCSDSNSNINLRDIYARSVMDVLRLKGRDRTSTRSSGGDEFWF
ncbi:potassium voltage-gated channel subfamily V member 1 [Hemicordylus capensis]|uniref:potassium voltage-gated channel subfamily V member 1 n=1 Tax=Hemicordylus capensis TaxID=884348 RepID=UPI002303B05D|nr:potassium voltage-gated channel subfamily V member 1 [Hemicordylus capensis]XP_053106970.1 potassium voltage-gated channel subfamily V member 1 [Hemicordylus capensis]XP_053106971.1 potassium voltage-gated channel subfamily V member 1 [Hemicordylus capensis]